MNRPYTNNIRKYTGKVSSLPLIADKEIANLLYNGATEDYEDFADYVNPRALRGGRIA